jgi:hypothetical protein
LPSTPLSGLYSAARHLSRWRGPLGPGDAAATNVPADDTIVGVDGTGGTDDTSVGVEGTIVGVDDTVVGVEGTIVGVDDTVVGVDDIIGADDTSVGAMKRHPALAPLSRDHHHALVLAGRLRRAGEHDAVDAAEAFLEHWMEEERLHFRLEEEVLLPAYAAYGDPEHPAVVRTLLDHVRIRRDADRLAAGADVRLLHELGRRLADHVRLEENELFPLIERTLPEPALAALGERLRPAASSE